MSIERYNEKRDFKVTPEPAGKPARSGKTADLRFVIQKHEASHLHYDFRLELDGVLLSWAVPKGPSLNPEDKRLAMHVEDHPLDYRNFEGCIPKGNYGGGTVMVWDEGIYYAERGLGKAENEKRLTEAYRKGKLTFFLEGSKLSGEFSLVRMRGKSAEDKAWLLIKADDAGADRERDVRDQDKSALSGRSMEEIAGNKGTATKASAKKSAVRKISASDSPVKISPASKLPAKKAAARKSPARKIPAKKVAARKTPAKKTAAAKSPGRKPAAKKSVSLGDEALALGGTASDVPDIGGPQLATLVDAPFDREGWVFEIKWDGYRALGFYPEHEGISLLSRNGLSFDTKFAAIRAALGSLPCSAIVDGEVVVLDSAGKSSFAGLQQHEETRAELVYYLFDLLYVDGVDVRALPLLDRKQLLRRLLENCDTSLQYSDHVEANGNAFFAAAQQNELEGIIAKDGAAGYHSGRTRHWLKIKIEQRQEFLIAGYTAPRRSRSDIGSLVLAYYERKAGKPTGRLRFAGHVGTGLDTRTRALLKQKLDRLARKTSPFDERVATNEPPTWAKPELVCEVRYTEKTTDCQLRHPVFVALRDDKQPDQIFWDVAEQAQAAVGKTGKARG